MRQFWSMNWYWKQDSFIYVYTEMSNCCLFLTNVKHNFYDNIYLPHNSMFKTHLLSNMKTIPKTTVSLTVESFLYMSLWLRTLHLYILITGSTYLLFKTYMVVYLHKSNLYVIKFICFEFKIVPFINNLKVF